MDRSARRKTVLGVSLLAEAGQQEFAPLNGTQPKIFYLWRQSHVRDVIIHSPRDESKSLSLKCLLVHPKFVHFIFIRPSLGHVQN
jgi:hypothetical protein